MRSSLTLFFFFLIFKSYGQNVDCSKFLSQKIEAEKPESIITNIKKMVQCSGLDSIDIQIFSQPPILGSLFVNNANSKPIETYNDLLKTINKARSDAGYENLRKLIVNMNSLANIKALPDNWEANKLLLRSVLSDDIELDDLHNYMLKHTNLNWTYRDLVAAYEKRSQEEVALLEKKRRDASKLALHKIKMQYAPFCDTTKMGFIGLDIIAIEDYEGGLNLAKNLHKPVLVYFSAYRSVNCTRLENRSFNDQKVFEFLENFVIIRLAVDDIRSLDPTLQYKSSSGRDVKTIGDKNYDLERSQYHNNAQPFVSVTNAHGVSLANSLGYISSEDFLKFLVDAKNKWDKNNN